MADLCKGKIPVAIRIIDVITFAYFASLFELWIEKTSVKEDI